MRRKYDLLHDSVHQTTDGLGMESELACVLPRQVKESASYDSTKATFDGKITFCPVHEI